VGGDRHPTSFTAQLTTSMATSYALPASAMTNSHGHHGHNHLHSHSHSPARQYPANTPRTLLVERSNGSMHSHSYSDSYTDHDHDHDHSHSHTHSHSHERGNSASYLPTPPDSNGVTPVTKFEAPDHQLSPPLSESGSFGLSLSASNIIPHDHGHLHPHAAPVEPRSKFTSFILPLVLRWPLLHTIMADKDSRRIFYFMWYGRSN
jgi:zinc transporter 5/7